MAIEILQLKFILERVESSNFRNIVDFETKISALKWSKKEILGHLIDSALHNWKRIAEISFSEKPYKLINYNQDELVKSNAYQYRNAQELIDLWLQINKQILFLLENQEPKILTFEIILANGNINNLQFLISDYITHLMHHLHQIIGNDFEYSK